MLLDGVHAGQAGPLAASGGHGEGRRVAALVERRLARRLQRRVALGEVGHDGDDGQLQLAVVLLPPTLLTAALLLADGAVPLPLASTTVHARTLVGQRFIGQTGLFPRSHPVQPLGHLDTEASILVAMKIKQKIKIIRLIVLAAKSKKVAALRACTMPDPKGPRQARSRFLIY